MIRKSQLQAHLLRTYIGLKIALGICWNIYKTNKDIFLFSGVKDSSAVILDIACYKEKTNTHRFTDTKQINISNLKICPIIDQNGTH